MGLIKSKSKKVAEKMSVDSGKPSLSIAFNVQKAAKKKKMAEGGSVMNPEDEADLKEETKRMAEHTKRKWSNPLDSVNDEDSIKKEKYASGGKIVGPEAPSEAELEAESMAQHIQRKRAKKLDFDEDEGMHLSPDNKFDGGEIQEPDEEDSYDSRNKEVEDSDSMLDSDEEQKYADGGEVKSDLDKKSVAKTILRKNRNTYADTDDLVAAMKEKYSSGGKVEFEKESGRMLNEFDIMNHKAASDSISDLNKKSDEDSNSYDQLNHDAANSEHDEEAQVSAKSLFSKGTSEQDQHDLSLVRAIRARLLDKRGV